MSGADVGTEKVTPSIDLIYLELREIRELLEPLRPLLPHVDDAVKLLSNPAMNFARRRRDRARPIP